MALEDLLDHQVAVRSGAATLAHPTDFQVLSRSGVKWMTCHRARDLASLYGGGGGGGRDGGGSSGAIDLDFLAKGVLLHDKWCTGVVTQV